MHSDATKLIQTIMSCSHRLNALGRSMGAITSRGGAWGLMKSLQQQGPQTIPDLARARPVSRQHIRLLAQSLIERGWLESIDNPEHKRSFLLRLTEGGVLALDAMDRQIDATLAQWLDTVPQEQLRETITVLGTLAEGLQDRLTPG